MEQWHKELHPLSPQLPAVVDSRDTANSLPKSPVDQQLNEPNGHPASSDPLHALTRHRIVDAADQSSCQHDRRRQAPRSPERQDMTDNRNVILAIVLSVVVLFGWQFFIAGPQMERAQRQAEIAAERQAEADVGLAMPTVSADGTVVTPTVDPAAPKTFATRDEAIAATARVTIETAELKGSISLTGGQLRYVQCPQAPFNNSSAQNVCVGL